MRTLVFTAALLVLLIGNLHGSEAQCGGFQASCSDYAIGSDGVFTAQCSTSSGGSVSASIALDNYISNANGNLVDGAGFSNSCESEGWINEKAPNVAFYIVADCRKTDGTLVYTTYDISYHVVNSNGALIWNNC